MPSLRMEDKTTVSATVSGGRLGLALIKLTNSMIGVVVALAPLFASLAVATPPAAAQTETVLYSFGSQSGDGTNPGCCLVFDQKGNLYGTTNYGGVYGFGTVFKLTPTGKETILYSFGVADLVPAPGGLAFDRQNNLYGTTIGGGTLDAGSVFKLSADGVLTVLHSFGGHSPEDGIYPGWGLILDRRGDIYGTTNYGGEFGQGTVFKVTSTGQETVVYSFGGKSGDAAIPSGSLIFDTRGNIYGTTGNGGAYGYGTVFKVSPTGKETVLYSFGGPAEDFNPGLNLVLDKLGNLYGTTNNDGAYNFGTVFKLTPTGVKTVLHSFGQSGDGIFPQCCLLIDKVGNLYGTTYDVNSPQGHGVAFKLTPDGEETALHVFGRQDGDGIYPIWNLVSDKNGSLYVATSSGGTEGYGTVLKLTP